MINTCSPMAASAVPRLIAVVVLPTPPFWLAIAITRAGAAGLAVVVVPVSFVSEHSETLVELDIEYRHVAERSGVPAYFRAATVGLDVAFIAGLARLVGGATGEGVRCAEGKRICPAEFTKCPLAKPLSAAAAGAG